MTAEEAIRRIRDHNEVHSARERNFAVYITEAFKTAIEALEKQIPKKPINEECYYICPCCRDDLGVSDDDIFIYELSMPKYCSNCGCVLDWTEVKNEV